MEHSTPSDIIFDKIKEAAISIWRNNYSDEFGYVTEKINRIESITNIADNVMVFYRMFDHNNQAKMIKTLEESSPEAVVYIFDNV